MTQDPDYGPRLSDEEYERRLTRLYENLPPVPTRKQDRQLRRQQLDLAIDHRLGRNFPRDRRQALWAVQQRLERKHFLHGWSYFLKRLLGRSRTGNARGLADFLMEEYGKVLSKSELEQFFGREEVRHPDLPVDPDPPK